MSALHTTPVSSKLDQPRLKGRSSSLALAALLVVLAVVTVVTVSSWRSSGTHAPTLSRVVGPDTFHASLYHEQVPTAPIPLRLGQVFDEQVPAAARG